MALAIILPATALPSFANSGVSRQLISILGLTTDDRTIGTVAYLALSFEERSERSRLMAHFQNGPGRTISPGIVLPGTITPEGSIGSVGRVSLKVATARQARMRQVLVPDQADLADADWSTPFLMQVSIVRRVEQTPARLTRRPAWAGGGTE